MSKIRSISRFGSFDEPVNILIYYDTCVNIDIRQRMISVHP